MPKRSIKMEISKVSFTGVIPTRVFIDGKEAAEIQNIQKGCRKLIEVLAGPIKDDTKAQKIARKFAAADKDYSYSRALNGYKQKVYQHGKIIKRTASDFFRFINNNNKNYIITGPQAEGLAKSGKELGKAKASASQTGINDSFELFQAKRIYSELINKFTSNRALRVREGYDSSTRRNIGKETILNIFLTSNRKYGKRDFKLELDNIEFKPYGKD